MIERWWPTEIGFYDNPDHDNLDLIDYCYEIQSKTEINLSMFNFNYE